MAFEHNTFTHALCTYFTVYYIEDKSLLFKNCYHWLQPNSYFVLHLVDLPKFTKIIPVGKDDTVPQKPKSNNYRTVDTLTVFKEFKYKAYLQVPNDKKNKDATLSETFTDNITKHVRKNEHTLFMEPLDSIEKMVKQAGFEFDKKVHMGNITGDENQFLYFFKKQSSGVERIKQLKENRDERKEQAKETLNKFQIARQEQKDARQERKDAKKEKDEQTKRINRKLGIFD